MCDTLEKHQHLQKTIQLHREESQHQQVNLQKQSLQQETQQAHQVTLEDAMETKIDVNAPAQLSLKMQSSRLHQLLKSPVSVISIGTSLN